MPTQQEKTAKTKEQKKQEAAQRRRKAEQQALAEQRKREEELKHGLSAKHAYNMLFSEVTGLYEEMDKLARKAPNEPITTLQLKILNSFIKKAKYLLSGDTIIDEVEAFVAAGDNPEYRDAVTVLRQIRQGLERFKATDFIFSSSFKLLVVDWSLELVLLHLHFIRVKQKIDCILQVKIEVYFPVFEVLVCDMFATDGIYADPRELPFDVPVECPSLFVFLSGRHPEIRLAPCRSDLTDAFH
jgi:hypothetical protein